MRVHCDLVPGELPHLLYKCHLRHLLRRHRRRAIGSHPATDFSSGGDGGGGGGGEGDGGGDGGGVGGVGGGVNGLCAHHGGGGPPGGPPGGRGGVNWASGNPQERVRGDIYCALCPGT